MQDAISRFLSTIMALLVFGGIGLSLYWPPTTFFSTMGWVIAFFVVLVNIYQSDILIPQMKEKIDALKSKRNKPWMG